MLVVNDINARSCFITCYEDIFQFNADIQTKLLIPDYMHSDIGLCFDFTKYSKIFIIHRCFFKSILEKIHVCSLNSKSKLEPYKQNIYHFNTPPLVAYSMLLYFNLIWKHYFRFFCIFV